MQHNLDIDHVNLNKVKEYSFLNEVCLIPSDEETKEEFYKRVERNFPNGTKPLSHCLNLDSIVFKNIQINPRFLPWVISKKGLSPWHLGVFITEKEKYKIQIHPRARNSKLLSEVLSHESIHYLRKDFDGIFEETLSYQASRKPLYRSLGFFLTSIECKCSLFLTFLTSIIPLWYPGMYPYTFLLSPAFFIAGYFLCKFRRKALFTLQNLFKKEKINPSLLLRLSPNEIIFLSKEQNPKELMLFWAKDSFRWKFLTTIYLQTS
jgi:hypothetical protein